MIRKVILIYPTARRFSGLLSTHRLPGLHTAHAGLTILAQILRNKGIEAKVYDEKITPYHPRLVEGADLVGVSIQTSWAPQGYRIAKAVRRLGIPVAMGGVHATLNPDEAIQHADYLVRGEGEATLSDLVDAIPGGGELSGIAGLSFWKDGKPVHNKRRPLMTTEELDAVPWPRLDLIEGVSSELRFPLNKVIHFTMLTRGCDQACRFCSITRVFGRSLRHRSVKSFVEELRNRYDPERQFLFFMDDSLASNPDFLKEALTALLDEKLVPALGWHSQMRAEVAHDHELLQLMRATNCLFVTCGFESVNPKSLGALSKGQSVKDIEQAIAKLRAHNVIVNGFFIFGTDHDTTGAMAETVRFAKRSGCMLAGFMPLTPFPGTPVFKKLDAEGRIFTRDWELYDVQHVVYRPKQMTALELYWKTLSCYPAFYTPGHILRHSPLVLSRRPSLPVLLIGASWSLSKNLSWAREVAANADYLLALARSSGEGAAFPHLEPKKLWYKDLVNGRWGLPVG